jgi:hypothetical protein
LVAPQAVTPKSYDSRARSGGWRAIFRPRPGGHSNKRGNHDESSAHTGTVESNRDVRIRTGGNHHRQTDCPRNRKHCLFRLNVAARGKVPPRAPPAQQRTRWVSFAPALTSLLQFSSGDSRLQLKPFISHYVAAANVFRSASGSSNFCSGAPLPRQSQLRPRSIVTVSRT